MVRISKHFLIYIISFLSLVSCENEKEIIHTVDPEMITYFASCKNGSWWTYADSATSTYDSMYVFEFAKKREGYPGGHEWSEFYNYRLKYEGNEIWAFLSADEEGNSHFSYITPDLSMNFATEFPGFTHFDLINPNQNNDRGDTLLPSYSVNNYNFENVLKIWGTSDTFYFAKNVGLVHFIIDEGNFKITGYGN